jgi:hypothetical protein
MRSFATLAQTTAAFASSSVWTAAAANGSDQLNQVINNLTAWLTGFLVGLATLCVTIGGCRYLIAAGEPSEIEKAKSALRSAAIGYALAALAPVIVAALKSIVQV